MNTLILNTIQSMDSLQIADLVQARHDSVKRTIERLVTQEVIEFPPTVEIKTATKPTQAYVFSGEQGKLDSITVVAQLCPQFTASIVKRWQELEHLVSADNYQASQLQNQALKQELLKQNPDYNTIKVMYDGGLENWQIKMAINVSTTTLNRRLAEMRKLGLIGYERGIMSTGQLCLEV